MPNTAAIACGLTVHTDRKTLCTNARVMRTIPSAKFFPNKKLKVVLHLNTCCTQPIHCQFSHFSSVNIELSTLSTGPITTTNIYKG